MREHIDLCQKNELVMATSVIAETEIFESSLSETQRDLLSDLFKRRNFRLIQVTRGISRIAHDIREHFRFNVHDGLPTVSTPDAVHLATAVYLDGCREFYTFDAKDEPNKDGKKGRRGLLGLDGFMRKQYGVAVARPLSNDLTLM